MQLKRDYSGFEMGRIRPPSEARSLLLRVTRNCPWNQCRFCGLYKKKQFSIRPVEDVLKDIDILKEMIDELNNIENIPEKERNEKLKALYERDYTACQSAQIWRYTGMTSVFLQDADSLIIKPENMIKILNRLREKFPTIERVTSYASSRTIARISDEDMKSIAESGLNRIHIGMESGCDEVLNLVGKGVDKKTHIIAGKKVKQANIELSEYYMPGLGGNEYSFQSAIETADALNEIDPDFIRIRTLTISDKLFLSKDYEQGIFTRTNDEQVILELLAFINRLDGISSVIKSDHFLNLIPSFEGKLPEQKQDMIDSLQWFLNLNEFEKMVYRIGRRTGIMQNADDMNVRYKRNRVNNFIKENNVTKDNIDYVIEELMKNVM